MKKQKLKLQTRIILLVLILIVIVVAEMTNIPTLSIGVGMFVMVTRGILCRIILMIQLYCFHQK
ncbi:sensor histidine kinase regulating citrate/malate metabolism [Kroppenstedtia sanguinis]|uniref:hypothetical protein n=1 Tax=Kroppenstedtia sanguinis TaxID=1380684 RepID=UPI003D2333B3